MSVKMGPYMAAAYVVQSLADDTDEANWPVVFGRHHDPFLNTGVAWALLSILRVGDLSGAIG